MAQPKHSLTLALVAVLALCSTAWPAVMCVGGPGSVSTSDAPYGALGLLGGGETATGDMDFTITSNVGGIVLTLCVTNTSPAAPGTETAGACDAPVICDVFFSVPGAVTAMALQTVNGVSAAASGWDFTFDPDACPDTGCGFIKSMCDSWLEGGPPGDPAPVIASIYDPCITDGPGDALASPVYFAFLLTFGDAVPSGFSGDWFCDSECLGDPEYAGAARFVSGANGGSGTVTALFQPVVPAPPAFVLSVAGLAVAAAGRHLRRTQLRR